MLAVIEVGKGVVCQDRQLKRERGKILVDSEVK
jgi:hypothetical protein